MMRVPRLPDPTPRLLPEGRRWGFGAHSVLPYLAKTLNARAGSGDAPPPIRNPVFPAMEEAPRPFRPRH